LIVQNGCRFIAGIHECLTEAVIGIAGFWIGFDVELKKAERFFKFFRFNKFVAQLLKFGFIEIVGRGLGSLQAVVLLCGLINA